MQLAATYGDAVLYQNSSNYMTESINNWDKRCNLEPKCIFMPSEADQVSKALSVLSSCGAQFAIRGGGHMNVGISHASYSSVMNMSVQG